MKKFLSLLIALSMISSLASCKKNESTDNSELIIDSVSESDEIESTEISEDSEIIVKTSVTGKEETSTETDTGTKASEKTNDKIEPKTERPTKAPVEQVQINPNSIANYNMNVKTEDTNTVVDVQEYDISEFADKIKEYSEKNNYNKDIYFNPFESVRGYTFDGKNIFAIISEDLIETTVNEDGYNNYEYYGDICHVFSYDIETKEFKELFTTEDDRRNEESEKEVVYMLFTASDKLYALCETMRLSPKASYITETDPITGEVRTYSNYVGNCFLYEVDINKGERKKLYEIKRGFVEKISETEICVSDYVFNDDEDIDADDRLEGYEFNYYDLNTGELLKTYFSEANNSQIQNEWHFLFKDGSTGKATANRRQKTIKLECDEYSVELSDIPNVTQVYMTQDGANIISTEKTSNYSSYNILYSYNFNTMECLKMNVDGYGTGFTPVGNNLLGITTVNSFYGDNSTNHAYYIVPELGRAFKIGEANGQIVQCYNGKVGFFRFPVMKYTEDGIEFTDNTCKLYVLGDE